MGPALIGIAVILCAALLLWQALEGDFAEER